MISKTLTVAGLRDAADVRGRGHSALRECRSGENRRVRFGRHRLGNGPQLRAHLRTEALSHTAIRIAAAPLTWPDADGQLPLRPSRAGSMAVRWPRLRNAFCSATE